MEAPASVGVIDSTDIRLFNYESLADALRDQRSFYIHTNGLNAFVGVRGLLRPGEYNSSILVTVDGRPANEVIYGQSHLDRDFSVPMEVVDRIELVRGPGSALYGSNADLAVVNVVTKNGADLHGGQLKLEGGTQDTGRAVAPVRHRPARRLGPAGRGHRLHQRGRPRHQLRRRQRRRPQLRPRPQLRLRVRRVRLPQGPQRRPHPPGRLRQPLPRQPLGHLPQLASSTPARCTSSAATSPSATTTRSPRARASTRWPTTATTSTTRRSPTPPPAARPAYDYVTQGKDDWVGEEVHYDWQVEPLASTCCSAPTPARRCSPASSTTTAPRQRPGRPRLLQPLGRLRRGGVEGQRLAEPSPAACASTRSSGCGTTLSPRLAVVAHPDQGRRGEAAVRPGVPHAQPLRAALRLARLQRPQPQPPARTGGHLRGRLGTRLGRRVAHRRSTATCGGCPQALEDYTFPDDAVQTRNGGTIWAHGVEAEVSQAVGRRRRAPGLRHLHPRRARRRRR